MKETSVKTRRAAPSDEPALRALYQTVFGDDDVLIDLFFDTWFDPELTVVAGDGDVPSAAAYILPVGRLALPDSAGERSGGQNALPCAMLYAIGTHPDSRGRGLGEAVTRAAAALAADRGYPAVVLRPADEGLFAFYAGRCGFAPFFDAASADCSGPELAAYDAGYGLRAVEPGEYRQLRQACLSGSAYIDMTEYCLGYQEKLSALSGGGLYALEDGGGICGCAVVERTDALTAAKELLTQPGGKVLPAAAAIARRFPADRYHYRTPCNPTLKKLLQKHLDCKPFGMLLPPAGRALSVQPVTWYGPAFD
jgi:GNAT superfamily N-acetyltransferase